MKIKTFFVCAFVLMCLSAFTAFPQDEAPAIQPQKEIKPAELSWVWGEVIQVDAEANQIVLEYLDYEADEEKQMVLIIEPATVLENISGINEIKPGDYASVDYLSQDGRNIAKNISTEKPELPSGEISLQDERKPPEAPLEP